MINNKNKNRFDYYKKFRKFILFIKVDENCNLDCQFCYQKNKLNKRIDNEEKVKNCLYNIDYVLKRFEEITNTKEYEYSKLSICFFGGEPLLNINAIDKILEAKRKDFNNKKIYLTFTSNGIIFNESVKNLLIKMKNINPNPISIMISTDNNKEAYDKNRKLKNSNLSPFETVQKNILKYKKFLNELNGFQSDSFVSISTVLATPEQIKEAPSLIQERYKDLNRSGKLLYRLANQSEEYLNESRIFLFNAYKYLIEHNNDKKNKDRYLDILEENVWNLKSENDFTECQTICTIDGDGNMNWCNKYRNFGEEIISQDKMRELSVFNKNADNSHFECVQINQKDGNSVKDVIREDLWKLQLSFYDPNLILDYIEIEYNKDDKYFLNFLKYFVESSEKEIFIDERSFKRVKNKSKYKIFRKNITNEINRNIFYLDKDGNLFFDKSLRKYKDLILTNIKEKHFLWIHTPSLLKSVNKFYSQKIL